MSTEGKRWGLLERIAAGKETLPSPRSLLDFIAERLLADMGQKYRAPLQELLETLQAIESRTYSNAPKLVRDTLSGTQEAPDDQSNAIENAYLLGMVAFANHLVAISIDSRFQDVAHEVIQDETYCVLLNRINVEGEMTVEKLAQFASREETTVKNQLYRLKELGIVGWRLRDSLGRQYFFREPGPAGWAISEGDRYYYITEPGKTLMGYQD
jgi:hypothetical protein